jgi:addiction module RelB/DinJ family antitoxin
MAQAIINFKTDTKLKAQAKEVLDEMGLNFSIAFNAYLRNLILERRIEFRANEIPNARLRKAFKNAEKEIKTGKYKVFKNHEDLEKHLLSS